MFHAEWITLGIISRPSSIALTKKYTACTLAKLGSDKNMSWGLMSFISLHDIDDGLIYYSLFQLKSKLKLMNVWNE